MLSKIEKAVVDAALERMFASPAPTLTVEQVTAFNRLGDTTPKPYRHSGPEWSAKMSRVMKKWHADRKKKRGSVFFDAVRLAERERGKKKRRLSPEGRAAIIAGTKAYWKRKKAGKRAAR